MMDDCRSVHDQVMDQNMDRAYLLEKRRTRKSVFEAMKGTFPSDRNMRRKSAIDKDDEWFFYLFSKEVKKYRESLLANPFFDNFLADKKIVEVTQSFLRKVSRPGYLQVMSKFLEALTQRIDVISANKKLQTKIEKADPHSGERKVLKEVKSISCCDLTWKMIETSQKSASTESLQARELSEEGNKLSPTFGNQKENVGDRTSRSPSKKRTGDELRVVLAEPPECLSPGVKPLQVSSSVDHMLRNSFCSPPVHKAEELFKQSKEKGRKVLAVQSESPFNGRTVKRWVSESDFLDSLQKELLYKEKVREIGFEDFIFLHQLGKGAFGKVYLVSRRNTTDIYAMKIIRFSDKVSETVIKSLQNEISIMNVLEGEFLVQAYFSFVQRQSLCIVMEYLYGGDFRNLLENEGRLSEQVARWYTAQLVIALSQLHSMGIIHRDLKPENLLLDQHGRLKLADFGLSEFRDRIESTCVRNEDTSQIDFDVNNLDQRKTSPIIGTPDYIPPEIILGYGNIKESFHELPLAPPSRPDHSEDSLSQSDASHHSHPDDLPQAIRSRRKDFHREMLHLNQMDQLATAIDWWAVGCLLYEFLVGVSPFADISVARIYDNITNLRIEWPPIGYGEDELTPEAKDLILRLLDSNPRTRFGTYGVTEIKNHPFFKSINWSSLATDPSPLTIDPMPVLRNSAIKMSQVIGRKGGSGLPALGSLTFPGEDFSINRVDLLYDMNIKSFLKER
jgi:serine/threonine protein kinase